LTGCESGKEAPYPGRHIRHQRVYDAVRSRLSEIARDGTANDRRKTGRIFFPLNRKAMTWPSSASKPAVRLEFRRPLRICRV
jgi:hypothetical protein